jgi:hypothetical protein
MPTYSVLVCSKGRLFRAHRTDRGEILTLLGKEGGFQCPNHWNLAHSDLPILLGI